MVYKVCEIFILKSLVNLYMIDFWLLKIIASCEILGYDRRVKIIYGGQYGNNF